VKSLPIWARSQNSGNLISTQADCNFWRRTNHLLLPPPQGVIKLDCAIGFVVFFLIVFAISMFVSASLLFLVEPMVAKMVLPLLGGTPAVWNTSLVFYQAVLLAGYLYAWASARWLGRKVQLVVHLVLGLACLAGLPPQIPTGWEPPAQANPVWSLLGVLTLAVGLPIFLLASTTTTLQRWFAQSGHRFADDPYFLYAASNTGSLVGLLGYPVLMEPSLRLSTQARVWSGGYVFFVAMVGLCGVIALRVGQPGDGPFSPVASPAEERLLPRRRLFWIALAFVPSALMIGITTALTTDVPAIPLLWVLPLAIYLLSFIFVFGRHKIISHELLVSRLPFILLLAILPSISKVNLPFWTLLPLYLIALFAVAMVCHGELARTRPHAHHLTEFYLWISFGGVLGGIFSSLLAPVIFSSVIELPLAIIFAAFLRPQPASVPGQCPLNIRRNDWLAPALLCVTMVAVIFTVSHFVRTQSRDVQGAAYVLVFGYSMLWCLSFGKRSLRFAVGLVALMVASSLYHGAYGQLLLRERNFFGVLRVTNDPENKFRYLFHGATVHGIQSLDSARSREPLAYYTRSGPAGSVMHSLDEKTLRGTDGAIRKANWAVIGLGAGSMACYRQPGELLTFYEIDPAVKQIATDPRYFTFMSQCAPTANIVLCDARLKLRDAPDGSYDLIVLDAFSGDTIPMHLLTRQAVALYVRKLAPGGILAFHVSNLHLRLAGPVAALARDAGLACRSDTDTVVSPAETAAGKRASQWMVMARNPSDLGDLATDPKWQAVPNSGGVPVWTDDYSSLLPVIKWSEH
jgi:hypothetical protein